MDKLFGIGFLFVIAAIIADLVRNPTGTGVLGNTIARVWQGGINGALGQTSPLP